MPDAKSRELFILDNAINAKNSSLGYLVDTRPELYGASFGKHKSGVAWGVRVSSVRAAMIFLGTHH